MIAQTIQGPGIRYRRWQARNPKAIFLLVHGLGGHSGRWEFLSEFFQNRDFSSYAIELKGFGETKDLKGHIDSFDIYFADIHRLYNIIAKENPGKKIFIIGESMGALISFLIAASKPDLFNGLICISPAFTSRIKFTLLDYLKLLFFIFVNPKKHIDVPFDSGMCTADNVYREKMNSNPREHRLATPKLLFNTGIAQIQCRLLKNKIKIPILFLLSGKDMLVDPEASRKVFNGLAVKEKKKIEYPAMQHALSIETGKEQVFEDTLQWMNDICPL